MAIRDYGMERPKACESTSEESPSFTTKLYERTSEEITLDEFGRVAI